MTPAAYLDASVLVSLMFKEGGTPAADAWLRDERGSILLSDFCWGEFVATIGRKVRSNQITDAEGLRVIGEAADRFTGVIWVAITPDDVPAATAIMLDFSLGLRLPDAIHLAITRRCDATLITADHRQGDAAKALGIGYVDPTRPA